MPVNISRLCILLCITTTLGCGSSVEDSPEIPSQWSFVIGAGPTDIGWNTIKLSSDGNYTHANWSMKAGADSQTPEWVVRQGNLSNNQLEMVWKLIDRLKAKIPSNEINTRLADGTQRGTSLEENGAIVWRSYGSNVPNDHFEELFEAVQQEIKAEPATSESTDQNYDWLSLWRDREPW